MRFGFPLCLAMIAALPIGAADAETPRGPEPPCALHVWPSNNNAASRGGWLSNLGIAGAMADYERNKDANLRDQVTLIESLTPPVQARLLADADLPTLLGMTGARVTFEAGRLEPKSVDRVQARRSASSLACYGELMVSLNLYQKSAVHGRTLTSSMTFKDYRSGRLRMVSARVRNSVPRLPGADQAAPGDLAAAFAANIRDFAAKVRRRRH